MTVPVTGKALGGAPNKEVEAKQLELEVLNRSLEEMIKEDISTARNLKYSVNKYQSNLVSRKGDEEGKLTPTNLRALSELAPLKLRKSELELKIDQLKAQKEACQAELERLLGGESSGS